MPYGKLERDHSTMYVIDRAQLVFGWSMMKKNRNFASRRCSQSRQSINMPVDRRAKLCFVRSILVVNSAVVGFVIRLLAQLTFVLIQILRTG